MASLLLSPCAVSAICTDCGLYCVLCCHSVALKQQSTFAELWAVVDVFMCLVPTGVPLDAMSNDKALHQYRLDLAHTAAMLLDKNNLIKYDRRTGNFQVSPLSAAAAATRAVAVLRLLQNSCKAAVIACSCRACLQLALQYHVPTLPERRLPCPSWWLS